jgi:hypothetical protein
MTTVFLAVFLMTMMSSFEKTTIDNWSYDAPVGTMYVRLQQVADDGTVDFASVDELAELDALLESVLDPTEVRTLDAVLAPNPWGPEHPDREWVLPHVTADTTCSLDEYGNLIGGCRTLPFPYQGTTNPRIYVGDAGDLAMVVGHEPDTESIQMLQSGGAVALWPQYVDGGELTLDTWRDEQVRTAIAPTGRPAGTVTIPAHYLYPGFTVSFGIMISPATADELGLDYGPSRVLASLPEPPTDQQQQALWAGLPLISGSSDYRYEAGPTRSGDSFGWAALGLTALISFAAASVAIGLARADGRRDEEVLDAIGAPRRLRRGVAFWQAIVIAGIGGLLGASVGLLPVLALHLATILGPPEAVATGPMPDFAPPWLQLGLTVVGVPLAIAFGSWATAGRRRVAVRRTE